jgi:DNA (cytosine-5)-methyltransferase 1
MKYISVCSGIEAATTAWHHLNWKPLAFSEIEPFPSAVLAHHWPTIPNLGNMTKHHEWNITDTVDLLVGGTPCQSFSVAGLRKGLSDPRGGLMLTYLEIAQRFRPRWIVWENVPGVLSSNGGRDFGSFLGALVELGYGWAYRVLDAQWFGVAQRRRRVFVVGCLGDAASAAKVLFESESVRRDYPPTGGKENPNPLQNHARGPSERQGQWWDGRLTSQTLDAVLHKKQAMPEKNRFPSVLVPAWQRCFCCEDFLCSIHHGEHVADCDCPPIEVWAENQMDPYSPCIPRFITPTECERLQGFPDDHTLIPWRNKPADQCPDGPRYKALGNSMAVPVMRWIGERIHKAHQEYLLITL